jgi:hypothetical protein
MAAAFSLAAVPAQADTDASVWTDLAKTYTATAPYVYEGLANDGDYVLMGGCVDSSAGGAGYPYVNSANIGSLDPAKPAALVYADKLKDDYANGDEFSDGRRLVAVEWIVKDTGQSAPTLFGQTFQKNPASGYFTLHAWLYEPNDNGLFAAYNPKVACSKT